VCIQPDGSFVLFCSFVINYAAIFVPLLSTMCATYYLVSCMRPCTLEVILLPPDDATS
jgi:hypothetical protein